MNELYDLKKQRFAIDFKTVVGIRLAFPHAGAQDNGLPSQMSYGSHIHEEPSKHQAISCNLYCVFSISESCVHMYKYDYSGLLNVDVNNRN